MIVEQELTQEEIQCRAKENSEYFSLLFRHYVEEHCDPEESYWW